MAKTKRAFATKKAVVTKPKNTTLEKRTEKKLKKQHTLQKLELKKQSDKEHEQLLLKRKMIKPPYQVLLDTNFILHSIKKKLQLSDLTTRTFISNVTLNIPRCVFAELEKLKGLQPITSRVSRAFIVGVCSKGILRSVCMKYEPPRPQRGHSPNMLIIKNKCYAKRV